MTYLFCLYLLKRKLKWLRLILWFSIKLHFLHIHKLSEQSFGLRLKFETLISAKDKVTQCSCLTLYRLIFFIWQNYLLKWFIYSAEDLFHALFYHSACAVEVLALASACYSIRRFADYQDKTTELLLLSDLSFFPTCLSEWSVQGMGKASPFYCIVKRRVQTLRQPVSTAHTRGTPIIGQLTDNRYRPFDSRHRPIIGRLLVLVSKTIKMFFGSQASRLRNSPSQAESDFRISVRL